MCPSSPTSMKTFVFPHAVALLILGSLAPLSAQNLVSTSSPSKTTLKASGMPGEAARFAEINATPGSYELPAMEKVQGEVTDEPAVFNAQDALNLKDKTGSSTDVESVVCLDVLRKPSPYRKIMALHPKARRYEVTTDSLQSGLAQISALYRETGKSEKSADCSALALSVAQRVQLDSSKTLEIVELEVAANPNCACEIVKSAISAGEADVEQVVAITEVAIHAAPDSMRIISQCAIAASPESISGVQALLAKLDPNAGETGYSSKSSKSAKSAKVASIVSPANPLDRPYLPPLPPPPIYPDPVTDVNPCR